MPRRDFQLNLNLDVTCDLFDPLAFPAQTEQVNDSSVAAKELCNDCLAHLNLIL